MLTPENTLYDVLATVDLGSNSFRLQISRLVDDQLYTLDALKETVRLGAGLGDDKVLDAETSERALACLARFGERLRGLALGQVRVVGTNTLRVARNAPEFIKQAEALLGFPIEVIAGREEARLIYLGAAHSLPASRERRLVVDIGGGSTEFIIGSQYRALTTESLPLGCVSYSMRYFPGGKLGKSQFRDATLAARIEIQRIRQAFATDQWQLAVGTSGTARSLRDILDMNAFSTSDITLAGMERLRQEMIRLGQAKSLAFNGLKADRAPVLAGGLAIMIGVFEELNIDKMTVAEGGLRDGVLYDLLGRQREHDMRETTVNQFTRRYHVDIRQTRRVMSLAERLFGQVAGEQGEGQWHKLLLWSARLHEIGLSIAHTAYHKHSAYILQYADMPGFSRREQVVLGQIVLGHRGDMAKLLPYVNDRMLWLAMVCLRMAVLFYRSRNDIVLPASLTLQGQDNGFVLTLDQHWLNENPLTTSALRQEVGQWKNIGYRLLLQPV